MKWLRDKKMYRLVGLVLMAVLTLVYARHFVMVSGAWTLPAPGEALTVTGHDWDVFLGWRVAVWRALFGFGELPFWNPWTYGGVPLMGNPQVIFPSYGLVLDLFFGPIAASRLNILLQHLLGLIGTFWMARGVGLRLFGALAAAGCFMLSTWFSLHVAPGHVGFAAMIWTPWLIGSIYRSLDGGVRYGLLAALFVMLILLEAGKYPFLLTCPLWGILALSWAVSKRSVRAIVVSAVALFLGIGLCGVKLMPEIDMMKQYPRTTPSDESLLHDCWNARAVSNAEPASPMEAGFRPDTPTKMPMVFALFFQRNQVVNRISYSTQRYGWHEYGCYLSPLALLLLFAGIKKWKRWWGWWLALIVCLILALGGFASWSPWSIMHHFPVYNSARVPARFLIPASLCFGVLVGVGIDALPRMFSWKKSRARLVQWSFLALVLIDLLWVGGKSFDNRFEHYTQKIPDPVALPVTVKGNEFATTAAAMANLRFEKGGDPIPITCHATLLGSDGYVGEVYFETINHEPESVPIKGWSQNSVSVSLDNAVPGRLVLNQNWSPGWYIQSGEEIEVVDGRPTVLLAPGSHQLVWRYSPPGFLAGLLISLCSVVLFLFLWFFPPINRMNR